MKPEALPPMPALRRAWLRELGIENVWALPAVQSKAVAAVTAPTLGESTAKLISPATTQGEPSGSGRVASEVAAPLSPVPPDDAGPARADRQASEATGVGVEVAVVAAPAGLVGWPSRDAGGRQWLVIAEVAGVGQPQGGPRRFLAGMLDAVGQTLDVAGPRALDMAALDEAEAVLLVGEAARRAYAPEVIGAGLATVNGVRAAVLPALTDLSTNAEGKAAAWRCLLRLREGGEQPPNR